MEQNDKPLMLNIGCGLNKFEGWVNVDGYGQPDVLWNLNETPWPWNDNSVDGIYANHVFEHLDNWMDAFRECARILKPGGKVQVNVPDHTATVSMGYIDHLHVLSPFSFHMTMDKDCRGTNEWARSQDVIPLRMVRYMRIPHDSYVRWWFPKRLLLWCCDHMVNFCHEQRFTFIKKTPDRGGNTWMKD